MHVTCRKFLAAGVTASADEVETATTPKGVMYPNQTNRTVMSASQEQPTAVHTRLMAAVVPAGRPWLVRVLLTTLFSVGAIQATAAAFHFWTGGSASSGNWSASLNWAGSDAPERNGTEQLVFPADGAHRVNTNNFAPLAPALFDTYNTITLEGGGYTLYGNPLKANIIAAYRAGSNSTIRLDLVSGFYVIVRTNNSTLTLAGDLVLTNALFQVYGAGDCVVSGSISGNFGVAKDPANSGELRLSGLGANTYTGDTVVNNGILRLSRYTIRPLVGAVGTVAVPGDLYIGTGNTGPSSDLVVLERDNQIADTSMVTVFGTGQLDLNDSSDTIGSLKLSRGSVTTGTGTLTVDSNVVVEAASEPSVISGRLALASGSPHLFSTLHVGSRLEIPAVLSGASTETLVKQGPGDLILGGDNSFDGPIVVQNGFLEILHNHALGGTLHGTTLEGGTLQLDRVAILGETLTVDGTGTLDGQGTTNFWSGDITLNTNLNFQVANAGTFVLSNRMAGSGQFFKYGGGTLRLTGAAPNTFAGRMHANEGVVLLAKSPNQTAVPADLTVGDGAGGAEADLVQLAASEQIADSSDVTVNPSGLLDLHGYSETIRRLFGNGAVSLGAASLTVSNALDTHFAGSIRGGQEGTPALLTKLGAGSWILTGTNTYYQKTVVSAGKLIVNGALTRSHLEIGPNGSLTGTGVVQSVSFSGSGGWLRPGYNVGRLLAQGVVTLSGGTLAVEMNDLDAGSGYDQLITDLAPNLSQGALSLSTQFTPPTGSSFVIIDNRSGSPVTGTFTGKPEGAEILVNSLSFRISYTGGDGNDVVVTRSGAPAVTIAMPSLSGGQLRLQAQGLPGLPYVLEVAPHLVAPIPWKAVATNVAQTSGLVQFIETDQTSQRFYRIVSP